MNFKDKLIKKLVDVGKKHRILVYPMLIFVAIISAISHAIYWGRGNGRKLVASVAIVALLITQSLFLTSSADVEGDEPFAGTEQETESGVNVDADNDAGATVAADNESGTVEQDITSDGSSETDLTDDTLADNGSSENDIADDNNLQDVSDQNDSNEEIADNDEWDDVDEEENIVGENDITSVAYNVVYTANGTTYVDYTAGLAVGEDGNASLESSIAKAGWAAYGSDTGVNLSNAYFDSACSNPVGTAAVADWPESSITRNDAGAVNLYYKATRLSYTVNISSDGVVISKSDTVTLETPSDDLAGSFVYTVGTAADYELSQRGYEYQGLSYGGSQYTIGQEITLSGGNYTLTADWAAQSFNISYDSNPEAEEKIKLIGEQYGSLTATYDTALPLPTEADLASMVEHKGYKLKGWTPDGGATIYGPGETLTADKVNALSVYESGRPGDIAAEGTGLVAVWEYRNVDLVLTPISATGNAVIGTETVTGEYGDYVDFNISAKYKDNTASDGNFSYSIAGGEAALNALGLSISETKQSGVVTGYEIKGTFTDINEDGAVVTIQVNDTNKISTDATETRDITIIVSKKSISLVPSSVKDTAGKAIQKSYDGDTAISTSGKCDVADIIGSDDVYATFDAAARLETPDVGEGKAVVLTTVNLAGADKGYYVLVNGSEIVPENGTVTLSGVATVIPGVVKISIARADGSDGAILFGQATPDYTLSIDNPQVLSDADKAAYEACSTSAEKMSFITNKVGFTGWNCSRTIYSSPGNYTIAPIFSSSGANYSADVTNAIATFTVGRDEGEGHYTLLGNKNDNNIYPDLEIKASNGYDKIRIVSGGDIDSSMTKQTAEAKFSEVVTVPDMTDGTIVIQMLDSSSGAITTTATLEHINVDRNGPVLQSFTVSPNKGYFNEFDFGTYYHAQDIEGTKVESVSITFEYTSEGSDCDKLYYKFLDENGEIRGGTVHEAVMTKDSVTGRYKATITIGTGTYGELVVYATNLAGNTSAQNYIKLNEKLLGMDSYYEWMVENSITASDIIVLDKDGNPAASGVWYNSLTYKTTATDNDSGLQFINWSINYPTGTTETEKENAGYVLTNVSEGGRTSYNKITGYTFSGILSSENIPAGDYTFGGTLYDNAGNSIVLSAAGPYKLDCKKPVIEDNTNYSVSGYDNSIDFTFTVTEGSEESGVASVKLCLNDEANELKSWGAASSYNYSITENGLYIVVATDYAGNVSKYEKNINNLSTEIPVTPVITVDGTKGNGEWYIEKEPTITITSEKNTSDGVPVDTYYNIIVGNKKLERTATTEEFSFDLANDQQGEVTIEAWSISRSGVTSDTATKTIYVDTDKPDLYITESTADDSGNLTINFKSTDTISGVNTSKVLVNGKVADVTNNDGVITGSFSSTSATSFEIVSEDIAGNVSDTISFVPMGLEVSPIMDIEDTSAYLSADVIKGTYDIAECYIQYKKSSASTYETALSNKYDTSYGKQMEYAFRNLTPDTEYDYKVYASTLTSKEVKTYEGRFKTSSKDSTGVVYGSVSYDNALTTEAKTYPIYVALYSGNTYIKSAKIDSAEDNKYKFADIADGTYRVVATNGILSKETSVTIDRGGVSYPTTYASDGGINFVLSGLSTEVVLEDNAVALTVDGLDKIYNTALYNGNVTPADMAVVAEGGTIKITLYASYMDVSSVSDTAETIFEDRLGNEAVIERYIDIEIIKEVRNAAGELVNGTPSNITTLAEPVTISFPLGSLSGQNIHVASLHGSGSDYSFKSWVNGSEAVLSTNYITITSKNFSVYALYRYEIKDVYYTVKWLDGDGNIMKTETVKSGESATPPTATPTKKETDKYTYAFEGWDTDYSAITGDTIISAWFTANKKVDEKNNSENNNPTSNNPTNNEGNNGNNNNNNSSNNNKPNNTTQTPTPSSDIPQTSVTPDVTAPANDAGVNDISTTPVRYTYMGSASSPKTGDATPIAAVIFVMLSSVVGMSILRKKAKENK